jgi:transcriptional regulator of acetoin/glycerol metabolism
MTALADENELRAARERLIEVGLVDTPAGQGIRPPIERSWRRSISMQATSSPSAVRFIDAVDPGTPLSQAAGVVMDKWQQSLDGMRISLFLSDRSGQIVARRVGDPADQRRLDRASAAEGFDFSEAALGTNGLGTAMEDRHPVFVQGSEHFNEALVTLACAGAPIRHPLSGRVLGSLAFASQVSMASPLMLAMAQQAAQQVEAQLAETAGSRAFTATMAYLRRRSSQAPIVVLSQETVLANVPGLPFVSADAHALLWEQLCELDWRSPRNLITLPNSMLSAVAHRLDSFEGGAVFALEITPASGADHTSLAVEAFPGPRVPRHVAELDRLAASGTVAISGPGGVGKCHSAREWLEGRTGLAPLVLDCAHLDPAWHAATGRALAAGRGVILRHLESLPGSAFNQLKALVGAHRPLQLVGGPRIALTFDESACPPEARTLILQLASTLRVPPLSASRDRVPELIRALIEQQPETARITLSPAVVQVLLRWDWPGNVAELRNLIDSLASTHAARVVQVADLPPHLRGLARRRLSPIEQLEYDAIVGELRKAKGNRSAAAANLGIGRTTLYRKMRAYGLDTGESLAP